MFPSNHKIARRKILFMLGSEESLKYLANSNDYNTPIINSLSEIWIESWSYVNPIFALTERGLRVKFSTNVFSFYVAICWISDPLLLSGSYIFLFFFFFSCQAVNQPGANGLDAGRGRAFLLSAASWGRWARQPRLQCLWGQFLHVS